MKKYFSDVLIILFTLLPLSALGWILVDKYYPDHIMMYQGGSVGLLLLITGTQLLWGWWLKLIRGILVLVSFAVIVFLVLLFILIILVASVVDQILDFTLWED